MGTEKCMRTTITHTFYENRNKETIFLKIARNKCRILYPHYPWNLLCKKKCMWLRSVAATKRAQV